MISIDAIGLVISVVGLKNKLLQSQGYTFADTNNKNMKTTSKMLVTILTAIFLIASSFTGFAKDFNKEQSDPNPLRDVNMIKVTGNVRVYLNQGNEESIQTETNQEDKISIKRVGGKLLIDAKNDQTVDVYLTVKNLLRIDVADNAIVKSSSRLNFTKLQVFLHGGANVDLDLSAQDVYTILNGTSSLKLKGSASYFTSIKDNKSRLNIKDMLTIVNDSGKQELACI